jgi:hypothetical protein
MKNSGKTRDVLVEDRIRKESQKMVNVKKVDFFKLQKPQ